jgi:hypothetical protein
MHVKRFDARVVPQFEQRVSPSLAAMPLEFTYVLPTRSGRLNGPCRPSPAAPCQFDGGPALAVVLLAVLHLPDANIDYQLAGWLGSRGRRSPWGLWASNSFA